MYGRHQFTRQLAHAGLGRRAAPAHRRRLGRMRGSGVLDWLKKAGHFIKDHGLISKVAGFVAPHLGGPLGSAIGSIGNMAGAVGLGRRRRRGGALRLAGAGYHTRRHARVWG